MRSALPRPLDRLRLPALVAPMFLTSNPDLVVAACSAGLLAALPALNQRSSEGFEDWLNEIEARLAHVPHAAPHAVNLIVHKSNPRLEADMEIVVRHKVPVVITAFGAVREVVDAVHSYGGLVFHDVASRRHAEKVAESGVDGLIALGSGAGGHTGHLSPFAAIAEMRQVFDGLIILAGAISSGADIVAARAMGADMVSMGTRFIATREAAVSEAQKQMMLSANAADVLITPNLTGAAATFMRPSIIAAGLDPENLPHFGAPDATRESKSWRDIWSAGQGVGSIRDIPSVAELCDRLEREYQDAIDGLAADPFRASIDKKERRA
ncbi:nitronate monooxygenase [Agrobacterium tumefaciens]|uniref:NAD(P)H-dependent flavin oxidoreductase n=1 Tax=Agrobacterium tumefaciens TaxID=358 RepID=UPI001571D9CB|nr:nitronate monooxygenase family protein [Agrobacterium tumefaciens]NTE68211.1 nitronate monooxygenase [Agrobacterium tumefaciens]